MALKCRVPLTPSHCSFAELLGAVTRLFVDSILGWYHRRLRTSTRERAQSGAVVAVQRASSDLKLNPHLHAVFLDGVYAAGVDGNLEFRPLLRGRRGRQSGIPSAAAPFNERCR